MEWPRVALRGLGQVAFQGHAGAGLLFLVALAVQSWVAALAALLGAAVGAGAAALFNADARQRAEGLYGFNGALVALGLTQFLQPVVAVWALVVVGAALSSAVALGLGRIVGRWGLPGLTAPFVLTTWVGLLVARWLGLEAALPRAPGPTLGVAWLDATLNGLGQIFFRDGALSGAAVMLGLLVASWRAALAAFGGALLGVIVGRALGAPAADVALGLWGFSAALTAIALPAFGRPGWRTLVLGGVAAGVAAALTGPFGEALSTRGLGALTAPFVVVTWAALLLQRATGRLSSSTASSTGGPSGRPTGS